METFRGLQELRDEFATLIKHLNAAILAADTREMSRLAGEAQVIADLLRMHLHGIVEHAGDGSETERWMARAADNALGKTIDRLQRVGLGSNVNEVRATLLSVLSHADFAHAYLQAALGYEME